MTDFPTYSTVLLETVITFGVLLLYTRILGKKQMSHLTHYNYMSGITIGSIAANIIIAPGTEFLKELIALSLWCFLTPLIDFISLKSSALRILLDGEPTIIIKKGKLLSKPLKNMRINLDDVTMLLREQNIFSIKDIDYAIMEPNGKISVLKTAGKESVTKEELQLPLPPSRYFPSEIIIDGKIVSKNLKELGLSPSWIASELHRLGYSRVTEIFYGELQSDGSLYVIGF